MSKFVQNFYKEPNNNNKTEISFRRKVLRRVHRPSHHWRPRGSQSGREKGRDESFQVQAKEPLPEHRLSASYFQKFKRKPAPDWEQKMLCIIVPNRRTVSPEFFS